MSDVPADRAYTLKYPFYQKQKKQKIILSGLVLSLETTKILSFLKTRRPSHEKNVLQ